MESSERKDLRDTVDECGYARAHKNPSNIKSGCCRVLLDTLVGSSLTAIQMVERYGQKFLISKTCGVFLNTGKDCLPQTGQNDFEYSGGRIRDIS